MEIRVEDCGNCKTKVSVVIPPERIKEELDKSFKQTAETVAFPGFRKGKAPRKLVLKRFGDLINDDVKERLIREAFTEAIEKHNLDPVSEPEIDPTSLELKEDSPFEWDFEVETKPVFELGEFKGVEVESDPVQVTDADIDEGIMGVRSRFAFLNSVKDATIDKKHYLTLDLTYRIEGEDDIVHEDTQANLSLGIVDGIEAGESLEAFVGKKADDTVEFEIASLPPHFIPENVRGKSARAEAKIKDIREVAFPEVDDEFLKKIQMESVEALRKKTEQEIVEKKNKEQIEKIEMKVMDVLIERHPFEIPEKLLMQQITLQEQNMKSDLLRMGIPAEKLEQEADSLAVKNREAAERNVRSNFIYEKIAEKENM